MRKPKNYIIENFFGIKLNDFYLGKILGIRENLWNNYQKVSLFNRSLIGQFTYYFQKLDSIVTERLYSQQKNFIFKQSDLLSFFRMIKVLPDILQAFKVLLNHWFKK